MNDQYLEFIRNDQQRIKALLGALLASVNSSGKVSLPVVDFAVDMFDRPDFPILNGYWNGAKAGWTIRGNKLIAQANVAAALGQVRSVSASIFSFSEVLHPGATEGASTAKVMVPAAFATVPIITITPTDFQAALYNASLSSADCNLELIFDVSSSYIDSGVSAVDTDFNGAGNVLTTYSQTLSGTSHPFGVCFSDASARTLGIVGMAAAVPPVASQAISGSTPSGTSPVVAGNLSLPAATCAGGNILNGAFSDFVSITVPLPGSVITANNPVTNYFGNGVYNFQPNPLGYVSTQQIVSTGGPSVSMGSNTLLVRAVGNDYRVFLNGALWFSTISALMPARVSFGLASLAINQLSNLVTLGLAYSGITSFKAWVDGTPEPADQTGHGTIVNGKPVYADKYHATAANGVVTYNPLA